jgi:hypothetical protein
MKKILITISFIVWCISTLLLVCSIIGIIVLIREDFNCKTFQGEEGEAVWFQIGKKLINNLIN